LDRFGAELPHLDVPYQRKIIGHIEARGVTHPVPAVMVRKGTI
jgi:hypothetical protein